MKSTHRMTIVWISLACCAALATLLLLILPSIRRIREVNQEMLQRKIALEEQFQQGQSTKKIANNLERVDKLIPVIDKAFLYRGDELAFITTIEAIADTHDLSQSLDFTVDASKQSAKAIEQNTTEVPVHIRVSGAYQDVYAFLNDIDRLPFYLTVRTVTISSGSSQIVTQTFGSRSVPVIQPDATNKNNAVTADIQGITYWREK